MCVCVCVCVCVVCVGGGDERKMYEGGGGLLETYERVQGGRQGSKIVKFERTYFLNDPLLYFHVKNHSILFVSHSNRSSPPEVYLGKGVLKICRKVTGEHPCQSAISIKLK